MAVSSTGTQAGTRSKERGETKLNIAWLLYAFGSFLLSASAGIIAKDPVYAMFIASFMLIIAAGLHALTNLDRR